MAADYSHPKGPKKFTRPQPLACLVPRAYLKTTYRGVLEVSVRAAIGSLLPAALVVSWGPHNDEREARPLAEKARQAMRPGGMLADAGYDGRAGPRVLPGRLGRDERDKPVVHRSDGAVHGTHRSQMTDEFLAENHYGRRWAVESFLSGLKRRGRG